jgi:hypothetical protein
VVSITEDPDSARFHHHSKRESHVILKPSLYKSTEYVAVSDDQDIWGVSAIHKGFLNLLDPPDELVKPLLHIACGPVMCKRINISACARAATVCQVQSHLLSPFAAFDPDVPLWQTLFLPDGIDLGWCLAFIAAIVPLCDVLSYGDLIRVLQLLLCILAEKQVACDPRSLPGAAKDTCKSAWINQSPWADKRFPSSSTLPDAVLRQWYVSVAGALARDRPLGLSFAKELGLIITLCVNMLDPTMPGYKNPWGRCVCIRHGGRLDFPQICCGQ